MNDADIKAAKRSIEAQRNEDMRKRLIALREREGLDQGEMADRLKPDGSTKETYRPNYVSMETGGKPISEVATRRIGQVFNDWSFLYQFKAPNMQKKLHLLLDEDEREDWQQILAMLQKHFFEENKNISPFLGENLQRFMEDWDYSFEWYASRMAVKITRDDKRIDLDADEQLALTTAVKDAIDSFFDNKLAAMKAEANGEDEEEIYCI